MNAPLLTIIIPVYNAARTVGQITASILAEEFQDFELILVDDGSTDNTLQVLRKIKSGNPRIIVRSQRNGGPSSARNTGLVKARGTYVQFYDADDDIVPGALQVLMDNAQRRGADLLVSGWNIDLAAKHGYKHIAPPKAQVQGEALRPFVLRSIGTDGTLYNLWNKLFRLDIIRAHDLKFREDLRFGEDVIFSFEYITHSQSLAVISHPLYSYRADSETSVFSSSALVPEYRWANLEALARFVGENPGEELRDLHDWIIWRWLLSYYRMVAQSTLPRSEKLALMRRGTIGNAQLARTAAHIGAKKWLLERIAWLLRGSPRLALFCASTVNGVKRLIVRAKTLRAPHSR